jgi:hypothetical protein
MRFALVVALSALCSLSMTAAAGARTILLGPPVEETTSFESFTCEVQGNCSAVNIVVPGAETAAPVDGVIATWSVKGVTVGSPYQLYTLSKSGTTYTANTQSTIEHPSTGGLHLFFTDQPIKKGEYLGIGIGDAIGFNETVGSEAGIAPLFQESGSEELETGVGEFAFDAELAPAPTITGIAPSSGPPAGGTAVTISGSDFGEASSVKFGTAGAASFTVVSESEITAVAPPSATVGAVPIGVTTIFGTGTSSQLFSYQSPEGSDAAPAARCVVPNLKGKKLKAARKALAKSHCKLGKVKGKRGKSVRVKSQHPKSGAALTAGSKVTVKLG